LRGGGSFHRRREICEFQISIVGDDGCIGCIDNGLWGISFDSFSLVLFFSLSLALLYFWSLTGTIYSTRPMIPDEITI